MTITAKLPKRLTEADIIAKGHTHIVPDSLRYDTARNKQMVTINTVDANGVFDGNTREIATSDLHQCFTTEATKNAMDKIKRNVKAKNKRAARKDLEPIVIEDEAEADVPVVGALAELLG